MRPAIAIAAGAVVVVGAVGLGWSASHPRLTRVSDGMEVCVPANAEGSAVFGLDTWRNDSGQPITITRFVPRQAEGLSVIGGYYVLDEDSDPGRGAQSDPALIPAGWTPRTVPPGSEVTLVIGVRLDDPGQAGSFTGGSLEVDGWTALGASVGESTTRYALAPSGTVCKN